MVTGTTLLPWGFTVAMDNVATGMYMLRGPKGFVTWCLLKLYVGSKPLENKHRFNWYSCFKYVLSAVVVAGGSYDILQCDGMYVYVCS